MNSFLPKDYQLPDNSNYMKFEKGANKFRIMTPAIVGWVYWNTSGKPVRLKEQPHGIPDDIRYKDGKAEPIKHFWAFVVWNYAKSKLQILEITQASIQGPITDLVTSDDWADVEAYDITVNAKGDGLDREYSVQPSPQKPAPKETTQALEESSINLKALYEGGDPFGGAPEITKEDTPFE